MRFAAVAALALLAGCGKAEPETPGEPHGYGAWKYRNFILGQTFSGGATLDGTVDIDASRDAGNPASDWTEVAINGNSLGRTSGPRVSLQVRLRPGPNWVRFFSSAARLGWEFQVDATHGTRVEFTPKDKQEFDMVQRKDE